MVEGVDGWMCAVLVKIGVLGSLDTRMLGVRVRMPASQRALLAALAVHSGDVVTIDALIEVLWGGRPPATCRQQLYKHVSAVREVLGDDVVLTDASGYLLNTAMVSTDVRRFEEMLVDARQLSSAGHVQQAVDRYRAALSLWRGPALADVESQSLRVTAARFDERRLVACEECAELQLRLGLHSYVIDDLRPLVAAHPFHERLAGLFILALYRGGRQAEALDAYQWMRARLVSELGVEPSEQLRRLHEAMLRHDTALEGDHATTFADRQIAVVPVRRFTGRTPELATLTGLLSSRSRVALLTGPAGIGKTMLAEHWSQQVRERFPAGVLHADLHGSEDAADPADVLLEFLRALGIPADQAPDDLAGRVALYRSLLDGTRTLVVLDDAAGRAQVEPLLPGADDCFTVITSRDPLEIGAVCLPIGPLAEEPPRPPARDQPRQNLRVSFESACAGASEEANKLLRYLSIVPSADFCADVAAALLDTTGTHARVVVAELESARLAEQHVPGRHRLHDVVKLFVRSRIVIDDDIRVIASRLLSHYIGGVDGAVAALSSATHHEPRPPLVSTRAFPDHKSALVWLHQETSNLIAAVRWANEHGQDALCAHLADALRCFFWLGYAASEWISTAWTGLDAAERAGDNRLRAAMHQSLGQALALRGEVAELRGHFTRALKYAEELGEPVRCGHMVQMFGLVLMHTNPLATTEEHYRTALDIALVECDRDLEIGSRVALAEAQVLRGRPEAALAGCDVALAAIGDVRVCFELGWLRAVRGSALLELGRMDDAAVELDLAVEVHVRCGNKIGSMYALTAVAQLDIVRGRFDHAWQIFHMAMDFAREFDHTDLRCVAGIGMASVHLRSGEDDLALALAEDALATAERASNGWRRAIAYDRVARASLARGDLETAAGMAELGLTLLVHNGWRLREGLLRQTRAWIHLAAGEPGAARQHADIAQRLHVESGQRLHQEEDVLLLSALNGREKHGGVIRPAGKAD